VYGVRNCTHLPVYQDIGFHEDDSILKKLVEHLVHGLYSLVLTGQKFELVLHLVLHLIEEHPDVLPLLLSKWVPSFSLLREPVKLTRAGRRSMGQSWPPDTYCSHVSVA